MSREWTEARKRAAAILTNGKSKMYLHEHICRQLAIHHPTLYVRYADQYRLEKMAKKAKANE